jgi:hypothetical protein
MSVEIAKSQINKFINSDEKVLELNYQYSRFERQEIHQYVEDNKIFSKSRTCPGTNIRLISVQKTPFKNEAKDIITPDLIDIFLKYSGYSMPNTEYFDYYLSILDLYLPASKKWNDFLQDFENTFDNDISKLKSEMNKVIQDINVYFDKSEEIKKFKSEKVIKGGYLNALYNNTRNNKHFVSIDIKKANYTILQMKTGDFIKGIEWITFLESFTKSKFLLESKVFREHIFGKSGLTEKTVNLSYQYLKNIQQNILNDMDEIKDLEVVYQQGDEIVYELPTKPDNYKIAQKIIETLSKDYPALKITYFQLCQIDNHDFYVKSIIDPYNYYEIKTYEFKKVPNTFIIQAVKYWFNETITHKDLKFIYQGILATFDKSIFDIYNSNDEEIKSKVEEI